MTRPIENNPSGNISRTQQFKEAAKSLFTSKRSVGKGKGQDMSHLRTIKEKFDSYALMAKEMKVVTRPTKDASANQPQPEATLEQNNSPKWKSSTNERSGVQEFKAGAHRPKKGVADKIKQFEQKAQSNTPTTTRSVPEDSIKTETKGVATGNVASNLRGLSSGERRKAVAKQAGGERGPQTGMLGGLNDAVSKLNKTGQ